MNETVLRKTRRSGEEILNLVREVKRMVEAGNSINFSCQKVGIGFKTYTNNQGKVRTNKHLYGNKYAFESKQRESEEYQNLRNVYETKKKELNQKEELSLRDENTKLKAIIANLMMEKI